MTERFVEDSLWFWTLLESANRNLIALCRILEELPKEQLRRYQSAFDERARSVNPYHWDECWSHVPEDFSEDWAEDFAAWVVMRGRAFFEEVAAHPERIGDQIESFLRMDAGQETGGPDCWDEEVDRPEYRGYQRADAIAVPIYRSRFGEELEEACDDERDSPREESRR